VLWPVKTTCQKRNLGGNEEADKDQLCSIISPARLTKLRSWRQSHGKCKIGRLFWRVNVDSYTVYGLWFILLISYYQRSSRHGWRVEVVCCHGAIFTTNEKPSASRNKTSAPNILLAYPTIPAELHILATPTDVSTPSHQYPPFQFLRGVRLQQSL
jgi:hypothetical protein